MYGCGYCRDLKPIIKQLCESGEKIIVMERENIPLSLEKYIKKGYPVFYSVK